MSQSPNLVSRFTGFFLQHKQLTAVLLLLVVVGGTISALSLRREGFPQVPAKVVVITTVYRGAAPAEVEQSITNQIESSIKDIGQVKSTSSTSGESFSSVVAMLDEQADVDSSVQEINSKISGLELPREAEKPEITVPTTGTSTWVFGLASDELDSQELLAQGRIFQSEVGQIKGIKRVQQISKATEKVYVTFDPAKLAATRVDASKISSTLQANNVNFPAGSNLTVDGARATALVAGRYANLDELGATPLPTVSGDTVALRDVATITREVDEEGSLNRVGIADGAGPVSHPGLVYGVDARSDADVLELNHTLTETLDRLQEDGTLSKQLKIVRLYDDAANTERQVDEIKAGAIGEKWDGLGPWGYAGFLVGGIWLLMLAMFLFVNLRTALIAGLAIPLSFFVTLMALYFNGITLNTLTLFAMILVLGLVVDPAIVVLESIQRYKDMGRKGTEGILAAISSIGYGLTMATLCSIIVFTPFGIVSGVFGEIIRFIPITVIPALVASFFVPLIFLAPMARFIKAHKLPPGQPHDEEHALWGVSRWFKTANLFILNRAWLQIAVMLVAIIAPIAVTAWLFTSGQVKSVQFSKPRDTLEALVGVSYLASYTDTQIKALADKTEEVLARHSEITDYYYVSQNNSGFTLHLNLTPVNERAAIAEDFVKTLRDELPSDSAEGIYPTASTLSYGPPVNNFPVRVQVYDSDPKKLKAFATEVADHARALDGVIRVNDGFTENATNAVQIKLNSDAATDRGLSTAAVGAQLAALIGDQNLTKLSTGDTQIDVVARYDGADKYNSLQTLRNVLIQTPTGPVNLGSIATLTTDNGSSTIRHDNGQRFASIQVAIAPEADQFKIQKDLNDFAKSKRAAYGLSDDALESKGEGDDITKSFGELFTALGIAILMIYLALALFFGSWLKPLIITFALPLSFLGVFPILAILKNEFGFLEILGLITLAGIVVNVGIFVIDYANHRVAEGMAVKEAIAQATAVRFRPIFLTKVVALGSLLPLAIFSPFWRGLTSVIIAGILTSGILSLFTTPILYTWFDKLSHLPSRFKRGASTPSATRPVSP
jgi:HAE1 family hydrophobic/amphiphilic exporter-1